MIIVGFDTATPSTTVAVQSAGGAVHEARHDPGPGERPGHATYLLELIDTVLAQAGVAWEDVTRIAVGAGPGGFTGLRIGVATARALVQASGAELVAPSTLAALARGAEQAAPGPADDPRTVLAAIDARRGEIFAAAFRAGRPVWPPAAIAPEALAARIPELGGPPLAVGDGAVRFRMALESAGVAVPADESPLHRVSARQICRIAAELEPIGRDELLPDYLRKPDAEIADRSSGA